MLSIASIVSRATDLAGSFRNAISYTLGSMVGAKLWPYLFENNHQKLFDHKTDLDPLLKNSVADFVGEQVCNGAGAADTPFGTIISATLFPNTNKLVAGAWDKLFNNKAINLLTVSDFIITTGSKFVAFSLVNDWKPLFRGPLVIKLLMKSTIQVVADQLTKKSLLYATGNYNFAEITEETKKIIRQISTGYSGQLATALIANSKINILGLSGLAYVGYVWSTINPQSLSKKSQMTTNYDNPINSNATLLAKKLDHLSNYFLANSNDTIYHELKNMQFKSNILFNCTANFNVTPLYGFKSNYRTINFH